MKIVFVSNYFNHHQMPFCEELYRRFGSDFTFISTAVMREERKKLGYAQNVAPEYVLLSYENEEKKNQAALLIRDADVVIGGGAPNSMLTERIRSGKLIFRYSERPFKRRASALRRAYHTFNLRRNNLFRRNIYMLCASAYAASDYASIGMYKNHMYQWGYFPAVKKHDTDKLLSKKKQNTILWCGRFIDWKHPDDAIELARKLKDSGYDFQLNMIGSGVMEEELKRFVSDYHLEDCVSFLGSMPPEKVRGHMEKAGIYLFTSDRQEGWGAVLNESMNSGCAVVASSAIGAVPCLIKDGENGLVYPSGDIDTLFEKVSSLLDNYGKQKFLGLAAYQTVKDIWNAEAATERLLQLSEAILSGEKHPDMYESGPCSKAKILKDN